MLLKERTSGNSVEVLDLTQLFSLFEEDLTGRYRSGDLDKTPHNFKKSQLIFTSGEELPHCWTDPHYRNDEHKR